MSSQSDYLSGLRTGGAATHGNSISGLSPDFANRLSTFLQASPYPVYVTSGFRDYQKSLYDNWVAGGSKGAPVAPPGHSHHETGTAADLSSGQGLSLSPEQKQWLHDHAAEYGLYFPMANEPWHVQPINNWTGNMPSATPQQQLSVDYGQWPWASTVSLSDLNPAVTPDSKIAPFSGIGPLPNAFGFDTSGNFGATDLPSNDPSLPGNVTPLAWDYTPNTQNPGVDSPPVSTTLPPDQNPFGQYTPPTQVTVPPDQFSMGVQPPLQDWSYNPDFSNSFNTPQTFNPDMGFQSSDRFLNPADYLSMGNPSAPGNAIQSFGGNPIDWGAQLPSIPSYPAYQAPSQGGTNISGFGGNASLGYDLNIPAQSLWTQANYGATGPASVGGTNISGFGGNTSLGYDFNAPVQDYWTQQNFDTGGTASQGGNLSLGGYGNPDPQWSGSLFDPNIYASGGNNAISSFGGLNDPSSFDITGGQSLGYVPQPGTNFYDNGDGTRYVYDSDWNYLGTQTSSAPAGSGGGSGGGSSTGVANSTPSPGSSSGIPGSIVSIGRSGNTFLQSPTGQIMGSVGGPTSMVPLPGSGFALSGVGAPGLIQLGAAGGWGTWTSGAGLSPEYILETPSGARSQARASKSPLDPYHAGLGKSAGASMFTKAG